MEPGSHFLQKTKRGKVCNPFDLMLLYSVTDNRQTVVDKLLCQSNNKSLKGCVFVLEDGKLLARSLLVTLLEQLKHARVLVRRDAQDMASPIHSIPSNHMFPLLSLTVLQQYMQGQVRSARALRRTRSGPLCCGTRQTSAGSFFPTSYVVMNGSRSRNVK